MKARDLFEGETALIQEFEDCITLEDNGYQCSSCSKCIFNSKDFCTIIACTPSDRDDERSVYFVWKS